MLKKNLKFISSIFFALGLSLSTYAGNKWTINIKNNSQFDYHIVAVENQCWYFDEVKKPFYVGPNEQVSFSTHESYHFPNCTIGWHNLSLEGFIPELTQSPIHTLYFGNTVDVSTVPYATSIKKVRWLNYSDKRTRDYLNWDHSIECDSSYNNGQMNVMLTVAENGDLEVYSDHCKTLY